MIVASCYTLGTPYEALAERLIASIDRVGMQYDVRGYVARQAWQQNCAAKVGIYRAMLDQTPHDLLCVDADATIKRCPRPTEIPECDLAVHWFGDQLASGTIYLRNVPRVKRLLDAWYRACMADPWELDQQVLQDNLKAWREHYGVAIGTLPPEMCLIYDHGEQRAELTRSPCVVHWQASRNTKRLMCRPGLAAISSDAFIAKLHGSIAVVGNGPVEKRYGSNIDAHDIVIRMNNFQLSDELAPFVGRRTDAWCVNCMPDVPYRRLGVPTFTMFRRNDGVDVRNWMAMQRAPHLKVAEQDFAGKARQLKQHPTTGFILLAALDNHGKRCDAYGFNDLQGGHYWDVGHEHDHPGSEVDVIEQKLHGVRLKR